MKHYLLAGTMLATLSATACSGGGSSGGVTPPGPITTGTPASQSSVSILWSGGENLESKSAASFIRRPQSSGSSLLPVTMTVQWAPQWNTGGAYGLDHGTAIAVASPAPSQPLQVSWAITGAPATVQTPSPSAPSPSPSPGYSAPQDIAANATQPGSGTVTATITSPTQGTQTLPVYVYPHFFLTCLETNGTPNADPTENYSGISIINGQVVQASSPESADAYIDSPTCQAPWSNTSETTATLHFPYGAIGFSSGSQPFAFLATSQWANALTSIAINQMIGSISPSDVWEFKTAQGEIVKLGINSMQNEQVNTLPFPNTPPVILGAYQEHGSSVDGF